MVGLVIVLVESQSMSVVVIDSLTNLEKVIVGSWRKAGGSDMLVANKIGTVR